MEETLPKTAESTIDQTVPAAMWEQEPVIVALEHQKALDELWAASEPVVPKQAPLKAILETPVVEATLSDAAIENENPTLTAIEAETPILIAAQSVTEASVSGEMEPEIPLLTVEGVDPSEPSLPVLNAVPDQIVASLWDEEPLVGAPVFEHQPTLDKLWDTAQGSGETENSEEIPILTAFEPEVPLLSAVEALEKELVDSETDIPLLTAFEPATVPETEVPEIPLLSSVQEAQSDSDIPLLSIFEPAPIASEPEVPLLTVLEPEIPLLEGEAFASADAELPPPPPPLEEIPFLTAIQNGAEETPAILEVLADEDEVAPPPPPLLSATPSEEDVPLLSLLPPMKKFYYFL